MIVWLIYKLVSLSPFWRGKDKTTLTPQAHLATKLPATGYTPIKESTYIEVVRAFLWLISIPAGKKATRVDSSCWWISNSSEEWKNSSEESNETSEEWFKTSEEFARFLREEFQIPREEIREVEKVAEKGEDTSLIQNSKLSQTGLRSTDPTLLMKRQF